MLTKYSPIIKCLTKNYLHKLIRIIKIILTNRSNNTENILQNYNHDDLIQQIELLYEQVQYIISFSERLSVTIENN